MPDFNALLDADPTTFERPPTMPEGEYLSVIKSREFGKSAKKQTPYVRFHYGVIQALESVSQEALGDIELSKAKLRDDFYFTEDALYRLREFFDLLGVSEATNRDSIEACVGKQVIITIGHNQSQTDPTKFYAEIRGYAAAEE